MGTNGQTTYRAGYTLDDLRKVYLSLERLKPRSRARGYQAAELAVEMKRSIGSIDAVATQLRALHAGDPTGWLPSSGSSLLKLTPREKQYIFGEADSPTEPEPALPLFVTEERQVEPGYEPYQPDDILRNQLRSLLRIEALLERMLACWERAEE